MNYPNEKFKSYLECDEDFIYNYLKKKLNITPFWSAKDFTTVTKQRLKKFFFILLFTNIFFRIIKEDDNMNEIPLLFEGTLTSPCLVPCLITKVKSLAISSYLMLSLSSSSYL